MVTAASSALSESETRPVRWLRIAGLVYVIGAIGYFIATRFGAPFNVDATYMLNQGALIAATGLVIDGRARKQRTQQVLASVALLLLLLWSFMDFATTVARMPSEIQSAKVQAHAACEEARGATQKLDAKH